jgi:hypothetical protein
VSEDLVHPPPDLLSQHRDGLLAPDLAGRIDAHVADCGRCRTELAALDATSRRLRDLGRQRVPMPPDVAARVEAAIAAEARQRPAAVGRRPADDAAGGPIGADRGSIRHRRRARVMVAAATIGVLGIGALAADLAFDRGGGTRAPVAGSASRTTTGSTAAGRRGIGAKTHALGGGPAVADALAIDQGNFETVAPLAITTGARAGRSPAGCFHAAVADYDARTWLAATVEWHGERAWLLFDPMHARGVVVDCSAHPRSMYRHRF